MDTSEFTNGQLKAINDGAVRAYNVGRGLLELSDTQQEAWLWVYENYDLVAQWAEKDKRNDKLRTATYHAGLALVRSVMRDHSGSHKQDFVTYTAARVQDLMPALFLGVTFNTGDEIQEEVRHKTAPNEGGNGLVSLVDVKRGFLALPQEQKQILFHLYSNGNASYDSVAKIMGISSMTVRRREQRALEAIVDHLGGPRVEARRRERVNGVS